MMYFSRVRINPDIAISSQLHHIFRGNGYGVHQALWGLFPNEKKRSFLFREEIAGEQLPNHHGVKGEPVYYVVSRNKPTTDKPHFLVDWKLYTPRLFAGDVLSFKLRANPTISRKQDGRKNSSRHDVVMDGQYQILQELAGEFCHSCNGKKVDLKRRILRTWQESKNSDITARLENIVTGCDVYRELLRKHLSPEQLLLLALKASSAASLEKWFIERSSRNGFQVTKNYSNGRLNLQAEGYRWHSLPKKGKTAGFSTVDFEGKLVITDPSLFLDILYQGIGPAKAFGCGLFLVRRVKS